MDKSLKNNKRMSLDPAKNPFSVIHRHHNATELEVRQTSHEESQSSIFNSDHSNKDLGTIFDAISKKTDRISCDSLFSLLEEEGYGDNLYAAVEMIALVDYEGKGYVTREQFLGYFSRSNDDYDKEPLPRLSTHMQNRQRWVEAIEENFELMDQYRDKEYCLYVAEKMKQELAARYKSMR